MSEEKEEVTGELIEAPADEAPRKRKNYGVAFNVQAGGQMYAPARDFAYNYPRMIKSVIDCFSSDYWPELYNLYVDMWRSGQAASELCTMTLDEINNAAFDELEQAKDAYCEFLNAACSEKTATCDEALEASGWNEVPVAAQSAWLSMLGQVMTGQMFQGIVDLQRMPGEKPAEIEELLSVGHEARRSMNGLDKDEEMKQEVLRNFRKAVREAKGRGLTFEQMSELMDDVKFGRVPVDS